MTEEPRYYQIPENWVQLVDERHAEVMRSIGEVLILATKTVIDDDDDGVNEIMKSAVDLMLAKMRLCAVEGWEVDRLLVRNGDLETVALRTPKGDYVLMAFPLEMLTLDEKMPRYAEELANMRKRAVE